MLDQHRLESMHRYWCVANYLTHGQIYLKENPLLKEPLRPDHIKPRLLGHWGTSPGLSFIYVHMNRLIKDHHLSAIYLARHFAYVREHLQDLPEVRDWTWSK